MKVTAFLDESGNTGTNLCDQQQPFYITGGFLIDESLKDVITQKIIDWESLIKQPNQKEIKSNKLLKNLSGFKKILNLMSELVEEGAIPSIYIADKKLAICYKMVEVYLDSYHNNSMPAAISQENRIMIGKLIYSKCDEKMIDDFARGLQKEEVEPLVEVKEKLYAIFEETTIADYLRNMTDEEIKKSAGFGVSYLSQFLNGTCCGTIVLIIEKFVRETGVKEWNIIHDETSSFADTIKQSVDFFTNPNNLQSVFDEHFNFGMDIFLGEYHLEENIKFEKSDVNPLIRAADYLCGMFNYIFKNASEINLNMQEKTKLETINKKLRDNNLDMYMMNNLDDFRNLLEK